MKKILPVLLALLLAFSLTSCSTAPAEDKKIAAQINSSLLPDYPQDVLPLYRPDALLSCGFSCRNSDAYDIGKDIYSVTYESTADQESLIKYYAGILTGQDETPTVEGDVINDRLSGRIGEYKVEIMFLEDAFGTTTVYLTLGLPSGQYVDANPYFSDYPADLVEQYGVFEVREVTYQQQYYGGKTSHYITVYRTSITGTDFTAHYKGAYANKQDFARPEPDAAAFSWQDGEYTVSVRYTDGDTPYITIDVSKAG